MKKILFIGFLICCSIFITYKFSDSFAQGIEWQRIRTGTLPAAETPIAGEIVPSVKYFIAAGDVLQIFIWQNPDVRINMISSEETNISKEVYSGEYFIAPGDIIEIFVWQNPDLTRDVTIGPDGKISYPLVGRIQASDLTIGQLEEEINEKLSRYIKYPQVSIVMKKFVGDQMVILDREVIVDPDGKISYPLVGRIQAAGLGIEQLEEKIKEKLPRYIKYSQASVVVKQPTGKKIIILGEVLYPGIYTYMGSINLIEAIALAGDFTDDARENSIMIVRGSLEGNPEVRRIDMGIVLKRGVPTAELTLKPNDVVYVPKTFIANFNQFLSNLTPTIDKVNDMFTIRREIRRWTYK